MILISLNIVIILLVLWSILRNYKIMNTLYNEVIEKSSLITGKLGMISAKIDKQDIPLQGSYAMGEAMCRRVDVLSKDIDSQSKMLTGLCVSLIPQDKMDTFFTTLEEYQKMKKKFTQSPPPPTADETSSHTQGSNNSHTDS